MIRSLRRTSCAVLAALCAAPAAASASEPAYPARTFHDSIGVTTKLSSPHTAYYNLYQSDRQSGNVSGTSSAAQVASLISDLGVKHIRYDICDPASASNCARGNDTAETLFQTYGAKVLDAYYRSPSSGSVAATRFGTPLGIAIEVAEQLDIAEDIVSQPGNAGMIDAFEGPNEPDAKGITNWAGKTSHAQFGADVLQPGRPAVANVPLLPAPMGSGGTPTLVSWPGDSDFVAWDDTPLSAANQHFYAYTSCPEAAVTGANVGSASQCPDYTASTTCTGGKPNWKTCANQTVGTSRPIVIGETGYHNSLYAGSLDGMSEKAAAIYYPRLLLEGWRQEAALGRGFGTTYIHELLDSRDGTLCGGFCQADREAGHGLVAANFAPKIQFHTLRRLLTRLDDPSGPTTSSTSGVSVSPSSQDTVRRLLFRKGSGYVLALWRPVKVWNNAYYRPWWQGGGLVLGSDINEGTAPNTTETATLTFPSSTALTIYRPLSGDAAVDTRAASTSHNVTVHGDVTLIEFS